MRLTTCVLLFVSICAYRAEAQVLYGTLLGSVEDQSGAVAPGVEVQVTNTLTGLSRKTATDERGGYLLANLDAGAYDVHVTASGFRPFTKTGVVVLNNAVVRVDVRLELGQATESVTVIAGVALLQTDRSDVSQNFGSRELTDLPVSGTRNFQSLQKLVPGFTPPVVTNSLAGNPAGAMAANVNGMNNLVNSTRVEGMSDSFASLPQLIAYVPPLESISAVNVATNSYDAEQGLAGGAVTNVTMKSGGNDLHGALFEYNTSSAMSARNFFASPSQGKPKNIFNQFGGTVSGPVVKNKLFYFGSYEGLRQRQSNSNVLTVPTADQIAGDFSAYNVVLYDPLSGTPTGAQRTAFPGAQIPANRTSQISKTLLSWFPVPNQPGPTNNYTVSYPLMFNRDNYDAKVNWNVSSMTSLFGRYSQFNYAMTDKHVLGKAGGTGAAGIFPGHDGGTVRSATLGGSRVFSPTFVVDGYVGFTRQVQLGHDDFYGTNIGSDVLGIPGTNGPDIRQSGFPGFSVTGFTAFGNSVTSSPRFRWDNQFYYAANASKTKGSHNFRWGFELARQDRNLFQPQSANPRGSFAFTGGATALNGGAAANMYNAMAQFLLGLPTSFGKATQTASPLTSRAWNDGIYFRDQWRATKNLTLNLGIRWEYYPTPTRDHSGFGRYDPDQNKVLVGGYGKIPDDMGVQDSKRHFAPRVGIAYRVKDKTVVRAGYGISIDPFMLANNAPLFLAYPSVITQSYNGPNAYTPAGSLETGIPIIPPFDFGDGVIDIPGSVATTYINKNYARGYIQSFNFTVQRELAGNFTLEAGYVGTRGIRQALGININAAPVNGGVAGQPLYAKYQRQASTTVTDPGYTSNYNSLQSRLTRRFAQGWLASVAYTYSKAIGWDSAFFATLSDFYRNRAVQGFDRTHSLHASSICELPFGKGRRWASTGRLLPAIVGGWQLNGVFSAYSGTPFTVTAAGTSLNAPGSSQVADQVLPEVAILGGVGASPYFDPLAYRPVTAARFGNSGLNTLRGPGVVNLDFGLFREVGITERLRIQIRAESFNMTNTPHFNNPNASTASMVVSGGNVISTGSFGQISSAAADQRQVRFALRLSF